MKPPSYPACLQGHHRNGSLVDDDGQIGYLSAIGGAAQYSTRWICPNASGAVRPSTSRYVTPIITCTRTRRPPMPQIRRCAPCSTLLYDDFIRQFGNLNDRKNIDLFTWMRATVNIVAGTLHRIAGRSRPTSSTIRFVQHQRDPPIPMTCTRRSPPRSTSTATWTWRTWVPDRQIAI